jgi:hypothetical protein
MSDQNDHLTNLQGRIIALELFMDGLLTTYVMSQLGGQVADVDEMRKQMFASQQLLERPADPETDAIWEAAVDAMNARFANVKKRVGYLTR